jgi:hypothetical protein
MLEFDIYAVPPIFGEYVYTAIQYSSLSHGGIK